MAKLTLQDVANLQNESTVVTALADNNNNTEIAMEKTLSRDGQTPNQMLSNLDMNNYKIINLPDALTAQEPATYSQLTDAMTAVGGGAVLDAPYVTVGNNATLLSERALTGSANVSITDTGPQNTVVVAVSDNELNALATTTAAANKLPYFDSASTATTTDLSAYGRTLIDDADATTARATLGSVIGTNVQAWDADLDAVAGLSSSGLVARTGAGTAASRTLQAPAAGFTITNPAGTAGDPTFVLANDLAGLEGMAGTGLAAHTASNTWTERTITGPAAGITVTNGGGVAGNPTLALANDLAAYEGLAANGLVARTATDTAAVRTITGPANGISVTNGDGVAGNPTLALTNDLSALEALSTTGIARRTGTDTWTASNAVTNAELQNSTITIGSVATSLGGTLTAATGRGSTALNIDQQTGHGDSNYTILATDRHVFTNAAFTAPRVWTLPGANAVNPGQRILIGDLQGTVTSTNTLQIAAGGSDTINGTTSITLSSASTSLEVVSDGSTKWYAVQSGSGGSGGGASTPPKFFEFVATASQTSFSGLDQNSKNLVYTPNGIEVYLNGLRLNNSDFVATTGSAVVLSLGANVGDLLTIVDYGGGGASSFSQYEYTATAGQVTFSGVDINSKTLGYAVGFLLVYVNGDLLNIADYTATNGTSIVFGAGRALNDQVKIIAMNQSATGLIPINNLSDVVSVTTSRQNLGLPGILRGYLNGLVLSTAGASTTFGIAAGVANDSTFTDFMSLASAYTKTTGAWALGTAAGSLDTGSIAASTWYHVYLIKRPDTGVVDVLTSLSVSAPTMPTNYTLFRRIGSMKANGSSQWTKFIQIDDKFILSDNGADANQINPGTAAISVTLTVPTGIIVSALFHASFFAGTGTNGVLFTNLTETDVAPFSVGAGAFNASLSGTPGQDCSGDFEILTNTTGQIRTRCFVSTATTNVVIYTYGWIDTRGKL